MRKSRFMDLSSVIALLGNQPNAIKTCKTGQVFW